MYFSIVGMVVIIQLQVGVPLVLMAVYMRRQGKKPDKVCIVYHIMYLVASDDIIK